MKIYNVTNARANLYNLLNEVNQNHSTVQISGKNGDAVLVSAEDWHAIEETLYLNSIPNMAKSILEASKEDVNQCADANDLEW